MPLRHRKPPKADDSINGNIDGIIKIVDSTPDSEFDNDNPVLSVNNLQIGEQDTQLITDLFRDYSNFPLQLIPCTI